MFNVLSPKQRALYYWFEDENWRDKEIIIATGAIRTGKTIIGSYAFLRYAMKLVAETPQDKKEKGYNLFAIVSLTEALALLNIIENLVNRLEMRGYLQAQNINEFMESSGSTFYHQKKPIGMLYVKDSDGNITKFLYLGNDNRRGMSRVTGLTLRGWLLDEAPLLGGSEENNIDFIERMIERTSSFRAYGRPLQMMTTNPQSGEDGLFYQTYIKGGWRKGIVVITYNLLDNPMFTQEDIDYYEQLFTKAQFERKIMGLWRRDNETLVYPKFEKEKHVISKKDAKQKVFVELAIGVDEGQHDARAFVLAGFTSGYKEIVYLEEYYHKNKEGVEPKDVNDYVKDFFATVKKWYEEYRRPINVYVDSASLYLIVLLKKQMANHRLPITINGVNKTSINPLTRSAVQERIDFTNMMFGTKLLFISEQCPTLITAYNKSIKKDGQRIDDGKTNNVDILDASEYAVKHRIRTITDKIMYKEKVRKDAEYFR